MVNTLPTYRHWKAIICYVYILVYNGVIFVLHIACIIFECALTAPSTSVLPRTLEAVRAQSNTICVTILQEQRSDKSLL